MKYFTSLAMTTKQQVTQSIYNLHSTFANHIMYLLLFDSTNTKGWQHELTTYLEHIQDSLKFRGKKGMKRLTVEDVFENLFNAHWEGFEEVTIKTAHRTAVAHNTRLKALFSVQDLNQGILIPALKELYTELAQLAVNVEATDERVSEILTRHIKDLRLKLKGQR